MSQHEEHRPMLPRMEGQYPEALYHPDRRVRREPPEYVAYMDRAAMALRRVRVIIYAVLVAFVALAVYGFLLIYQLTNDILQVSQHMSAVTRNMSELSKNMQSFGPMAGDIDEMERSIYTLAGSVQDMSNSVITMNSNVKELSSSAHLMSEHTGQMTQHTGQMSQSMDHMVTGMDSMSSSAASLDRSFSPAMGFFNNFFPFGGGRRGAPPTYPAAQTAPPGLVAGGPPAVQSFDPNVQGAPMMVPAPAYPAVPWPPVYGTPVYGPPGYTGP